MIVDGRYSHDSGVLILRVLRNLFKSIKVKSSTLHYMFIYLEATLSMDNNNSFTENIHL